MRKLQLSRFMNVFLGVLLVCFLLGTSYIALKLSALPAQSFLASSNKVYPLRYDFIQVLIRTEKDRVIGAAALVNSIISNTLNPVYFYFITDPESSKELNSLLESSLHDVNYIIKQVEPLSVFNTSSSKQVAADNWLDYTLIHIPKLFPQITGRLIVLSDDAIVQGNIVKLNNVTIDENHYGALSTDCDTVSRIFDKNQNRYYHYLNLKNPVLQKTKIDGKRCIFNMGVMVLNMTLWIKDQVTDKLNSYLKINEKENIFHINNVLSSFLVVFYDKVTPLDSSWHVRHLGVTSGSRYATSYLRKANLLHWDGHFKPWNHKSPYSDFWQKYNVQKYKS